MKPFQFVFLFVLSICLAGMAFADTPIQRGTTQDMGEPGRCTGDIRDQVSREPIPIPKRARMKYKRLPFILPPGPQDLIDSIEKNIFVPAGDEFCVRFDYRQARLTEYSAAYSLTAAARNAIAISPTWLQRDLEYNLSLLEAADQDELANLLLNLDDPRTIDEVAFTIAHLSWKVLTHRTFEPDLLEINAELMYTIDEDLQYVAIIDYDLGGGNFYSTTSYETLVDGTPTTVEIPGEIYYWWIVMPKVSDEKPLMDESVYNMPWREYLYYENDPGYPKLQEKMLSLTYLWDGEEHNWPGSRPFTDDMLAVDAVGKWCSATVPDSASGNRPIQPNVIAHEHNGNCGELQDLLCAAARACLIPLACAMDINEDHVWCEMWLNDWHPYQVELGGNRTQIGNYGIAYDYDHGGSKDCSCIWDWRNDGYTWDVIERYSNTCTLSVYIDDPNGVPVDNASVVVASEGWHTSNLYAGAWGETGQDGTIQFILGNNQNFYIQVKTSLGNYPSDGYALIISDSLAGEDYYWNWTTPEEMTRLDLTEGTPSGTVPYWLEVQYELPYDVQHGKDYYAMPIDYYAEKINDGCLNFFISDHENYMACQGGQAVTGYGISDSSSHYFYFQVPSPEDFYIVFSGAEHHGLDTLAELSIKLWQGDLPDPEAADIVTGPGPGAYNPPLVRIFDTTIFGDQLEEWSAYGPQKFGVNVACGDVADDIMDEVITGPGPGTVFGPHVRAFNGEGKPLSAVSFIAYGTRKYGVNVTAGDLDRDGFDEIVTGPGPGAVFGPHIRGWNVDEGPVTPIHGVSYMAYGTRRWGANVFCGDIDGDGYTEIITGAGPGTVFGPHVRGWNYDGSGGTAAMPKVSYFAYGTPKWGVNVSCGDLDGDGYDEILTGPGPGSNFGSCIRGWNYDDDRIASIDRINFFAYPGFRYGALSGAADIDADGYDEILAMPGPGPDQEAEARAWNYDGEPLTLIGAFAAYHGMDLGYGGKITGGHLF